MQRRACPCCGATMGEEKVEARTTMVVRCPSCGLSDVVS
jgi:transposase